MTMTKRLTLTTICLLFVLSLAHADGGLSVKDKAKIELGKQKLYGGRYKSALGIFKEILNTNQNDGTVLYYVAECHYKLGEFDKALEFLEKGKACPNPKNENFFLLGLIYLNDGKIDEALTEFQTYKSKATTAEGNEKDVDVFISHCNNAKKLMLSPVDVEIVNLGKSVNSAYDDKGPAISADGKKLFFNSRRPETTDSPRDVEGDGKFFEDIYFCNWDSANAKWTDADQVPGQINEEGAHDACTGISPDGKQIFIYRNNLNDPNSRGGDVFISKVVNGKWKTPEPIGKPINSSYWEGGATISPDGKTLYFVSERKGGFGRGDIWMVKRKSKTEWEKPVNLGAEINSEFDEAGIFLAPDGKTMFFCSNGHNSMGSYDIFRTTFENGKWSKPVNLGYPINTERRDGPLVISADINHAYFSSDRKGGLGENDIYMINLKDYAILEKDFKKKSANPLSIVKGMIRDGFEGKGMDGVDITFSLESGEKITSTVTNESGEYFITLKGDVTYIITVSKKGYKEVSEKINLPMGKGGDSYILEKQFLIDKK